MFHYLRIALGALRVAFGGDWEQPVRSATAGTEPRYVAPPEAPAKLALVLSGGSLRGFAHVGVLTALAEAGVRPDLVVGASAGAIAGGLYASGVEPRALASIAANVDFDLGRAWGGKRRALVHDFVAAHLRAARIEDFPIRFAAVATDFRRGTLAVFNAGDAAVAIQASTGAPGVFLPTPIDGGLYADGGLASPVPVRVARALGAERVVAVNVVYDPIESRLRGTIDRLFQIVLIMTRTLALAEAREADVLIEPALPPEREVTLDNRAALIAAGAAAGRAAIARIRALSDAPAGSGDRSG